MLRLHFFLICLLSSSSQSFSVQSHDTQRPNAFIWLIPAVFGSKIKIYSHIFIKIDVWVLRWEAETCRPQFLIAHLSPAPSSPPPHNHSWHQIPNDPNFAASRTQISSYRADQVPPVWVLSVHPNMLQWKFIQEKRKNTKGAKWWSYIQLSQHCSENPRPAWTIISINHHLRADLPVAETTWWFCWLIELP